MRWNETIVLVDKSYATDDEGVPQPSEERSEVFCNPQRVGALTWSSMYEIGISCDAQVELMACDYADQRDAFYRDRWYSVEAVQEKGDKCVLTLRHQKSDTDDFPEGGEDDDG